MAKRFTNVPISIAGGQALSNMADLGGAPVYLHVPAEWSSALMSFQVSPDGTYFYDLFSGAATEMSFNVAPGTAVSLAAWMPVAFLKIRSGTRDNPVPQQSDLSIIVTVDTSVTLV